MSHRTPVTVAILNDYEIVVTGLSRVLAPFADRLRVVELDSNLPVVSDVDLLLYDTFGRDETDRVDLESFLAETARTARVVVFTWNTEPSDVERALSAGVAGYISKTVSAEELVQALVDVHSGERVVVLPRSADDDPGRRGHVGRWPGDELGLSPRESEILALICQGISNEEVGERAFIGLNTVKTHIRSTYRKIGVTSRSQAVAWGLQNGFDRLVHREFPEPSPRSS